MIFQTKHSTYEVNQEKTKIRRLRGENAPLSHQGQDGDWKSVAVIMGLEVGSRATLIWGATRDGKQFLRRIITSKIIRIVDENLN